MKPSEIDQTLQARLEGGNYYTLEDLEAELGIPRADIHRSFRRLGHLHGWSIRPFNSLPYGRQFIDGRKRLLPAFRRKKGDRYEYDPHEPDWKRTLYLVRRPNRPEPPA